MRNTFGFNATCFMVLLCIVLGHGVSAAYAPNMGNQGIRVHNNHHLGQVDNVFDVPFVQNNVNNNQLQNSSLLNAWDEQGSMQQRNNSSSLPPLSFSFKNIPFSTELPRTSSLPNGLNNNEPLNDQASMVWDQSSIRLNPSPCFTQLTATPFCGSLANSYNNQLIQQSNLNHGQQPNNGLFNDGSSIGWNNNERTDSNASPCFTLSTTSPFNALAANHNNPLLQNNNLNDGQETNNGFPSEQPPSIAWDNESTGFNFNPPSCFTQRPTAPSYASLAKNNYNNPIIQNNLNNYQDFSTPLPTFRSQEQQRIGLQEKSILGSSNLPEATNLITTIDNEESSRVVDVNALLPMIDPSFQRKKRKVSSATLDKCQSVPLTPKNNIALSRRSQSVIPQAIHNTKRGKFTCYLCSKPFSQKHNLTRHIKSVHFKEKRHKCPHCGKRFTQSTNLKKHVRVHTGEKSHPCLVCKKPFTRNDSLKKHVQEVHTENKPFVCVVCNKSYTQKSSLFRHIRNTHFKNNYECPKCNKSFARPQELKKHIETIHLKMYQCPKKGIHINKKMYNCPKCERKFNQIGNLNGHILSAHNQEKTFKCDLCNKKYTQKHSLNRHILSAHNQEKTFKCDLCNKKYTQKHNLNKHILSTHSQEKMFKCDLCNKKYTQKHNLNKHILSTHNQEKTFKCDLCNKKYTQKHSLNDHMKKKHSDVS